MITVRKSQDRGHANHGWLDSYHSFSFAEYFDPAHMQYSVLRVINEDKVAGGMGFGMHPHRDMEIITYMLAGELKHQDSMGNGSVIRAGDVQRMTAGTGIRHSEVNASSQDQAHLLQIWLIPAQNGLPPSYQDQSIPAEKKLNRWCLVASPDAREHSLMIHQDVELWATVLQASNALSYAIQAERCAYLHVARGQLTLNGQVLSTGDAVMLDAKQAIEIQAQQESEVLLFDLPELQT
ncbi:Pirin-related protein [Methylophilaceae bacterium 11]|nr:Pirin-related protein [Methylophilaceae bacterium 11]